MMYDQLIYEFLSQYLKVHRGILPTGFETEDNYIMLANSESAFSVQTIQSFIIYTHHTLSFSKIVEIKNKIYEDIKNGLLFKGLVIYPGNPYYQDRADENENTKSGLVNLLITNYNY